MLFIDPTILFIKYKNNIIPKQFFLAHPKATGSPFINPTLQQKYCFHVKIKTPVSPKSALQIPTGQALITRHVTTRIYAVFTNGASADTGHKCRYPASVTGEPGAACADYRSRCAAPGPCSAGFADLFSPAGFSVRRPLTLSLQSLSFYTYFVYSHKTIFTTAGSLVIAPCSSRCSYDLRRQARLFLQLEPKHPICIAAMRCLGHQPDTPHRFICRNPYKALPVIPKFQHLRFVQNQVKIPDQRFG